MLKTILGLIVILSLTCSCNRKELVFNKIYSSLEIDTSTHFISDSSYLVHQEILYQHFSLQKDGQDTLNGYWGINGDTVLFISDYYEADDKCTQAIPMFSFSMDSGQYFKVVDVFCQAGGHNIKELSVIHHGKYVEGGIEINVFEHYCDGSPGSDVDYDYGTPIEFLLETQSNRRFFHVSKLYGVLKYYGGNFNERLQYNNCPYYPQGPKIPSSNL